MRVSWRDNRVQLGISIAVLIAVLVAIILAWALKRDDGDTTGTSTSSKTATTRTATGTATVATATTPAPAATAAEEDVTPPPSPTPADISGQYRERVAEYKARYGMSNEWEQWMYDHQDRYEEAFRLSLETPEIITVAFIYASPIAYDPPWSSEDEHMSALETVAEGGYPGYDFDFVLDADPAAAFVTAFAGSDGTSYASGNTVNLYYETIFNHELAHVLGIKHHYSGDYTVKEYLPPGEPLCLMARNTNQFCSACRTALGLPLDVEYSADVQAATGNILDRYPY